MYAWQVPDPSGKDRHIELLGELDTIYVNTNPSVCIELTA